MQNGTSGPEGEAVQVEKTVLVFIDESGDAGFKLAKGSSPIFAVAMVMFGDAAAAQATQAVIADLRVRLNIKPEFKFGKSSDNVRDQFFHGVREQAFRVRAIVVQKKLIYSPNLRTDKEKNAKVVIDGAGERSFRNDLAKHLRQHTPPGAIDKVRFMNSVSDPLVQLADMCVGAIARSYREDKEDPYRWRRLLSPKIDDVWEFQ